MSVLMSLQVHGDATRLEHMLQDDPDAFSSVAAKGKAMGATYHRFYATGDEILVVDEWPTEEAFHSFFDSTPEIGKIMAEAGVHEAPQITFWRKLDLRDDIG